MHPSPHDLALHAARKLLEKGAEDMVVLHLPPEQRSLYEYVVIGNGRSERQVRTLADEVYHFCKRHGIARFPVEGEAGWMLVDCHEVVVHAFTPEARERFRLESLWPDAERLDVDAALAVLPDPDR